MDFSRAEGIVGFPCSPARVSCFSCEGEQFWVLNYVQREMTGFCKWHIDNFLEKMTEQVWADNILSNLDMSLFGVWISMLAFLDYVTKMNSWTCEINIFAFARNTTQQWKCSLRQETEMFLRNLFYWKQYGLNCAPFSTGRLWSLDSCWIWEESHPHHDF